MVHVTRSFRPEVVTFGPDQFLQLPLSIDAGKSIVVNGTNAEDGPADGAAYHRQPLRSRQARSKAGRVVPAWTT